MPGYFRIKSNLMSNFYRGYLFFILRSYFCVVLCFYSATICKWKFKAVRNAHLPDIDSMTADRALYTH